MVIGLVTALTAAALFGVGAVAQAHSVRRLDRRPDHLGSFVHDGVRDVGVVLVVIAYLAGFVLHAVSIWFLPLYLAQGMISLSMPITAVTSAVLLREPLGSIRWLGVAGVTSGLVLLALGSGEPGPVGGSAVLAGCAWLGVVVLLGCALRWRRAGAGVLGALAGAGYSGSAIATRGVDWSGDPASVALALTVPAYGLIAFWIYSMALDRSDVTAATAPLIVGQTFIPALIGVLLLGDSVRDGWAAAVLVGLTLATAGAIVLAGRSATTTGRARWAP